MMKAEKTAAVILAGGKGTRMHTNIHKQYLLINSKPVLYYALQAFENSFIDDIILVCGEGEEDYCRREIVKRYGFKKVKHVVPGGKERYHSVMNGLSYVEDADYILIHDGARPFVTAEILERNLEAVRQFGACVTAVPAKDTVKIADERGFAKVTPERKSVWIVQTPQTFRSALIKEAYCRLLSAGDMSVTDDAQVVERYMEQPVKFVMGAYENIKITTPEDLDIAQIFAVKSYR